jgi:hypothetical protein
MDHADFRTNFDCGVYHGDLRDNERGGQSAVVILRYEPDKRCPDLVVWAIAHGQWIPGFRKGWNRASVMAHLGLKAA